MISSISIIPLLLILMCYYFFFNMTAKYILLPSNHRNYIPTYVMIVNLFFSMRDEDHFSSADMIAKTSQKMCRQRWDVRPTSMSANLLFLHFFAWNLRVPTDHICISVLYLNITCKLTCYQIEANATKTTNNLGLSVHFFFLISFLADCTPILLFIGSNS